MGYKQKKQEIGEFLYRHRKINLVLATIVIGSTFGYVCRENWKVGRNFQDAADLNRDGMLDNSERARVYEELGRNIPVSDVMAEYLEKTRVSPKD